MSKKKKDKKEKTSKKGKSKDPSSRLKALQKDWKKAAPKKFGQQAPDGSYEVKIVGAVIEEAKAESKRLQIRWTLKILDGDYKGREITHRSGLEGQDALSYLQGELDTMELEIPENITDITELLPEAIGLDLLVSLSTRNEFQNIRFEELLEADEADDDLEEDEEEEDEDEDEDADEDEEEDEEEEEEEEDDDSYPTDKEIMKMKKKALLELIEEYELEVDPEGLTQKELAAAVIEASEEDEEAEDEDEDEDDDD